MTLPGCLPLAVPVTAIADDISTELLKALFVRSAPDACAAERTIQNTWGIICTQAEKQYNSADLIQQSIA